ncbi:MAG TPA: hypothetical protein PK413_12890, partial [Thermoanaerobaculia bacterium]|nr:hypothetical protein [Thermoanaerobaculia bacterium]
MLYLRTLIDLLETLERQAPEGAGTLPVASERNGGDLARIFVDRGQLSWLWCRLGTSSLADFLSGSGSLSAEQISELARESVRDGEPISAKLARRAGLDDKQLREALLSFTADALTHVVKALADGRAHIKPFEPSPAGAFQLRYSFAASEILPRVLAA